MRMGGCNAAAFSVYILLRSAYVTLYRRVEVGARWLPSASRRHYIIDMEVFGFLEGFISREGSTPAHLLAALILNAVAFFL